MKCFPKRLIYIKTNFYFLFGRMQYCPNNRIYISALSQHSHKKRKNFLLILLTIVSRIISEIERNVENQHWIASYPMECYLNSLTYIKQFSFFNWIGSCWNKPFFLDLNVKVFVSFLSLVKNTKYNIWNQHWKLIMLYNVVQIQWFTLKQITSYI